MTDRAGQHAPPIRLAIVDDSPLYRLRFAKLFGRRPDVTVVGVASEGEEAVRLVASTRPDVLLLDLTMPGMDGFAVLRWVMAKAPLPVVVCSSRDDRAAVFKALELGAVDYVVKAGARADLETVEPLLVERVLAAADARLEGDRVAAPLGSLPAPRAPIGVVAVAASTGGPAAIQRLVRHLPRSLEVPILVVQHMPAGFTRMFAERLARESHYSTSEAVDGAPLVPRSIVVAPGGAQTRVVATPAGGAVEVAPRAAGDVHAPSADLLFASVAEAFGPAAAALVLTGMGDDGSRGACAVRARGGYVLVESVETALIYGMPRATVATGCVDAQLPLERMADALRALAGG